MALSLFTIASAILWVSPRPYGKLLGLQLGLFIIALHASMLAIGGIGAAQTGAQALYSEFGLGEFVFRTGHFDPAPPELWRLNWPGAMVLNAVIMLLFDNNDASFVLTINLIIWIPLMTLLGYLFMRSTIGKDNVNHCMAGTWIFFIANWVLYYIMPSVLGYLLLLTILGLLAILVLQRRNSFAHRLNLVLLLLVLPAIHLLTAIVTSTVLLALYITRRTTISGLAMTILVTSTLIWTYYITNEFFEWRLPVFMEQIEAAFRLDILWNLGVTERMVGSEAHHTVNQLRVVSSVIFIFIGLAGSMIMLKGKKITINDKFVVTIAIGILVASFIISGSYKWELIQRTYIFMVPAIAYFGVKLLKYKITAIVLTILLIVGIPLHFVTQYGNALVDNVSPAESRGTYFFHEHTTQGFLTGAIVHFPIGTMVHRESYYWVFIEQIRLEDNMLKHPIGAPDYTNHYVYLRPDDQAIYEFLGAGEDEHINDYSKYMLGEVIQHIDSSTNFNLICINPELSLYSGRSTLYDSN
ncbi:MAG: hypothetical protein HQ553_16470 [Chloroflexi bacterium]|nr:hypothetical protein [Chloroflexota bacterium]